MVSIVEKSLLEARKIFFDISSNFYFHESLERSVSAYIEALKNRGIILIAGNRSSGAEAQRIAGELVSLFIVSRPSLAAITLTNDTSVIAAVRNDYEFDQLFARKKEALGKPGVIFISYSTSGNSKNIINGFMVTRSFGLVSVQLTGNRKGLMCSMCDYLLEFPSSSTPRIQEGYLLPVHTLCALIENALFPLAD